MKTMMMFLFAISVLEARAGLDSKLCAQENNPDLRNTWVEHQASGLRFRKGDLMAISQGEFNPAPKESYGLLQVLREQGSSMMIRQALMSQGIPALLALSLAQHLRTNGRFERSESVKTLFEQFDAPYKTSHGILVPIDQVPHNSETASINEILDKRKELSDKVRKLPNTLFFALDVVRMSRVSRQWNDGNPRSDSGVRSDIEAEVEMIVREASLPYEVIRLLMANVMSFEATALSPSRKIIDEYYGKEWDEYRNHMELEDLHQGRPKQKFAATASHQFPGSFWQKVGGETKPAEMVFGATGSRVTIFRKSESGALVPVGSLDAGRTVVSMKIDLVEYREGVQAQLVLVLELAEGERHEDAHKVIPLARSFGDEDPNAEYPILESLNP